MPKRAAGTTPIELQVDRQAPEALDVQIAGQLRHMIMRGTLGSGARLPSTRALAKELAVARNVVIAACAQLVAEGYLESRVGSGTRVAIARPEGMLRVTPSRGRSSALIAASLPAARQRPVRKAQLSFYAGAVAEFAPYVSLRNDRVLPFKVATPSLDDFPVAIWQKLWRRVNGGLTVKGLDYSSPAGLLALRRAIAAHVRLSRGVHCDPGQVVVFNSAQQSIDAVARSLVRPGDPVWLEDPCYRGALVAFSAAQAKIVPVPVDSDGIDVGAGIRRASEARLAYVTPSHQYPLAVTLSLARRIQLLDWARRRNAYVLEDDYDCEFRFHERPIAALRSLDDQQVIYLGTFSKSLFPGVRLAYLVLPQELVDTVLAVRHWSDGHAPAANQEVLARFLEEGHFERHLRRMLVLYRERHAALLAAAAKHWQGLLQVVPGSGGMHTIGWLSAAANDRQVAIAAAAVDIDVLPISAFRLSRRLPPGLTLGFAPFRAREINAAATRLAQVLIAVK